MTLLSGGQLIVEYLEKEGVPYLVGVPGHGNFPQLDALVGRKTPKFVQVKHEQAAAHLADGYFKATGKPLAVTTSIGPGAFNTLVGVATAYLDSSAMLVLTGSAHTYMQGRGLLQEVERKYWSDFRRVMEPITKWSCEVTNMQLLPRALAQAFREMLTGRPGPVHLDLPMDIQAEMTELEVLPAGKHRATGRMRGDEAQIAEATKLLAKAERPVIVAGGGVAISGASGELMSVAEFLGAPVVTTLRGNAKGVFPEDHPLCGFYPGTPGSTIGNELCKEADVILAVGFTFYDEAASSYKSGTTFNIPPTKLVQVDVDPKEVGKNYPVEVGIIGDAKVVLADLHEALSKVFRRRDYSKSPYFSKVQRLRKEWEAELQRRNEGSPMTMGRFFRELREILPRNAILVTDAGWPQTISGQMFPSYLPRTYITAGTMSTMGFALPGAIGAKLGLPDRQVVSAQGDGSFLMIGEELATAVQYDIPVVEVILNNFGFTSIRDTQLSLYKGRVIGTSFLKSDGSLYSPDFVKMAEAYGCRAERLERPEEVAEAVKRSVDSGKPSVIEVMIERQYPRSSQVSYGWWDLPVPKYLNEI